MNFERDSIRQILAGLAAEGIFVGTSSWKYAGWRGQLYDEARYVYRGRFSESRFERNCLAEYAGVFQTVSLDAAYYQLPTRSFLEKLVSQVTADFRFSLKVTDEFTLKRFPHLPRFARRAGQPNPHFLDAEYFTSAFLKPCEEFRQNIGLIMFEFARLSAEEFARGRDFVAALDGFLSQLPKGWDYGVEVRTASLLQPEYFAMLARHNVAHIFNSWDAMPPTLEQISLPKSFTARDHMGARFLLRPGRRYEEAVKLFSPYDRIREPYPEGRAAASHLIQEARAQKRRLFLYVNNRFEGNALDTLAALLAEMALASGRQSQQQRGSSN